MEATSSDVSIDAAPTAPSPSADPQSGDESAAAAAAAAASAQDLDFLYADADEYTAEIAELYTYTEEADLRANLAAFEQLFDELQHHHPAAHCASGGGGGGQHHPPHHVHQPESSGRHRWTDLDDAGRLSVIEQLLNRLEVGGAGAGDRLRRQAAVRALLYIAQGNWGECELEEDQLKWTLHNAYLLLVCGTYHAVCHLLCFEIDTAPASASAGAAASGLGAGPSGKKSSNPGAASASGGGVNVTLADSAELRLVLSLLYILVETARCFPQGDHAEGWAKAREQLIQELQEPVVGNDCLAILLFNMVTKFCSSAAPHYPMRKVLLLLWKVVLLTLGPLSELHRRKNVLREGHGLPPIKEETTEVCGRMRASSPPLSAADMFDQMPRRRTCRKSIALRDSGVNEDQQPHQLQQRRRSQAAGDQQQQQSAGRCLYWRPKVSERDLEAYLQQVRAKFVGFRVQGDLTSLAGLPPPIHESVRVLRENLYVSLAEVQMRQEREIVNYPLTKGRLEVIPDTPTEHLYRQMLPNIPQYMIALLKVLLAAAPTSKPKTETINLVSDLLPEEMPQTLVQSVRLSVDVNRHKEVIVKAISALLLLLLKHLKISHVYQFEFVSQHLVFANCIPLVLKFFNQNILSYVESKNGISQLDFPGCVVRSGDDAAALQGGPGTSGAGGAASAEEQLAQEATCPGDFCWRNLFSCVNLLRVLNKLTKWKHSRTMMLVVFKSAPILKRALKVRNPLLQVYALKLIKAQTKYMGRQWRKINMTTMSAIYEKVRHRLTDDWAYANDLDARPWDFQAEECSLRNAVDRFNQRRYSPGGPGSILPEALTPFDNNVSSVLNTQVTLTDHFKRNYQNWLEQEVFSAPINWDLVLSSMRT